MKHILKHGLLIVLLCSLFVMSVNAAPTKPGGNGGQSSGSSSSVSYTGASTISSDTTNSNETYSSTTGGENALLVSGGTSTISNASVTKSGDESSESSDFYGTNAAVLVYNGAILNYKGGSVTTNGSHANGVFAYGSGTINISDATIKTNANNSGGVMVTGGGTLNASNLTVTTEGNSSASIRSDRGGGTLTVTGGTYTTNGTGSPAIYSTADIRVSNASLVSTKSEGVVVEGANSVTLKNTNLTDTNTTLNGNSETYKNIFLYQSMSGDADTGTASFTAEDSTITTNQGDTFYVTNTTATISLTNNTFTNTSGDFLRVEGAKWGTSGSNGGDVSLSLNNQTITGNIILDNISTLTMSLADGSTFKGAIDNANTAQLVDLTLSNDSVIILTGDTYVDSLINETSDNSNIYLNGYSFYVNGVKISANEGTAPIVQETTKKDSSSTSSDTTDTEDNNYTYIILGVVIGVLVVGTVGFIIYKKKNN